jgi:SEC-C motif
MATEEVVMAKVQRNQPCPCGSGSKAKRCCYGPERIIEVRVMPLDLTEDAVSVLRATSVIELRALFDQLFYLPELDLSLQVPLPGVITPEIDQAIRALRDEDGERFDRVLATVVPTVDTVDHRITLARAIIALRDQGRISVQLAAMAVFELDREQSILFTSAVAESIGVLAGEQRTPNGLLIAS